MSEKKLQELLQIPCPPREVREAVDELRTLESDAHEDYLMGRGHTPKTPQFSKHGRKEGNGEE